MAVLIRNIALKNFKSIANCRVDLSDIALLVGPNGAGKSNFIDSLRLVSDALDSTIEYAIRQRGGINEVRRRSGGHPTHFAISLRIDLGKGTNGFYAIQVGAKPKGAFHVQREQASVGGGEQFAASFDVRDGELAYASEELNFAKPKVSSDRLFLTAVSGLPAFRRLFDALSGMRFFNINPDELKEPQPHDSGAQLHRSGSNLGAVVKNMEREEPRTLERIQEYLRQIVPGIVSIEHRSYGPRESIEFRQRVVGQGHPWRFHAANMSDGILRSLGVLTALFHNSEPVEIPVPLVTIEEPEITIHPHAAGIVMDAMIEASRTQQILATTHSPDLLDHDGIDSRSILAVRNVDGETRISPVDQAAVAAIREALYTPGDLLRLNQLTPDASSYREQIKQSELFEKFE